MNIEFCEWCNQRPGKVQFTKIEKRKKTEFLLCEECLDSPREPKPVSLQEVEDLKKELEITSELHRVTNEANDRTLALLAGARYELKKIHDALPDYCYRCERRCRYAGMEESTGAQRCAECLLIDAQAQIRIVAGKSIPRDKLVSVVGQWKEERDHGKWTIQDLRKEIERLRKHEPTLTPCSYHKGFKEDCGCL